MKRLFIVQIILVCTQFFQGTAATVPIADGNTWIYQHTSSSSSWPAPHQATGEGLFTMSMDSVSILGDSVLFRVITRDSGISKTVLPVNWDYAYDTRDTNTCLLTNNMLLIMDTSGLWKPYVGSMLSYAVQPDTVYYIGDTLADSMPMPIDYQRIDYQRKTDSTAVIINGMDTANFYTAVEDSLYQEFVILSVHTRDTIQWLETTGPFYQNTTIHYSDNSGASNTSTVRHSYSLLSFNGTPISITPTSGVVRNTTPAVKQNVYRGHRKIVWLGNSEKSYINAGSNRYNIMGRRINSPQGTQLLILQLKKKQ